MIAIAAFLINLSVGIVFVVAALKLVAHVWRYLRGLL